MSAHPIFRHKLAASIIMLLVVALGATALLAVPHSNAQGPDEITFNEPQIVTLTPGQTITRTFNVLPGDTVEIKLSRLADFNYTAVLIDPDQSANPLVPDADGNVVFMIESAALSGTYSLVFQASAGQGDLLIQVNSDAVPPMPLPLGETTATVETTAVRYELVPPADAGATTLTLTALTPTNSPYPTLPAYSLVNADSGEVVFNVNEGQVPYMAVTLPAQQAFLLALAPAEDPNTAPQQVIIAWGEASASASSSSDTTQGQTDSSQSDSSQSDSSQTDSSQSGQSDQSASTCQMLFTGPVNVRSGPSTDYTPPIGQAQAGSTYPVTGHDGSFVWYQINYNGVPGWVSGQVNATQLQGDCNNISPASYPPLGQPSGDQSGSGDTPALTATPVPGGSPTPTATMAPGVTPTYTYTPVPGATQAPTNTPPPTATYTPSYTPTQAAQIAPPDSNYRLVVPLDGTLTISEVISYPDGDVEDVVSYDVSGLNNNVAVSGGQANLTFQLQCSGTGTEFVNFRIDGRDYPCGGTFNRTVNADSRTGAIRITLNGGSASYVQWTVIGSAPRTN